MSRKIDPALRAYFKEEARKIIGADRQARNYGGSHNTIGAITSALIRAYQLGKSGGNVQDLPGGPVDDLSTTWLTIPSRCRDTLSSLSFWLNENTGGHREDCGQLRRVQVDGRRKWRFVSSAGQDREHLVSAGSADRLVDMGLIGPVAGDGDLYCLTNLGYEVCAHYWKRSDERDPTLPKHSLR